MSSSNGTMKDEYDTSGNTSTAPTATTSITIELNTDMSAAQRFPVWIMLCVSSIVCVIALQSRRDLLNADDAGEKWVFAVGSISFVCSLAAIVMYLCFRTIFVSNIPEAVMVGLLIAFWAAGLPTIMDPNNRIAVSLPDDTNVGSVVTNANLYFFSWCSFCCAVYLSGSLLQDTMAVSVTYIAAKAARWYGLVASSLVVMGTASRTFRAASCADRDADDPTSDEYCRRCKFAISLGAICFVAAALMTFLVQQKKQLTAISDFCINTIYLILWCFGVSFITFGASPGSSVGNLYFSTWISFIISVFSFGVSFREFVAGKQQPHSSSDEEQQPEY